MENTSDLQLQATPPPLFQQQVNHAWAWKMAGTKQASGAGGRGRFPGKSPNDRCVRSHVARWTTTPDASKTRSA